MALILNIDTATEIAFISISDNDKIFQFAINYNQQDHASFLQPAIKKLLLKLDLSINKLNAIAVTAGPGSYTGLRVGMASAKGLCYALNIPLITINTLEVMALSAMNQIKKNAALYCPMIDARRMEVFTAIYDHDLNEILKPCSLILDKNSFAELLKTNTIYFSGDGAAKMKDLLQNDNAVFLNTETSPDAMAKLSYKNFINKSFADVSFSSPFYLKEFHTILPSSNTKS